MKRFCVKKGKQLTCLLLIALLLTPVFTAFAQGVSVQAKEIVAGGYEINMDNVPSVHFEKHKDWENLFSTAWQSHKSNIRKANTALNPENVYYVDEAFDNRIFQWDTLFMMLFDKYGYAEFPVLQSMDNFYYHQVDSAGDDNGFINRMIYESNGQGYYSDYRSTHATNPPLYGWAEWEQYKVHGDKTRFLKVINGKTILQRLDEYFQFIKRNLRVSTGLYTSHGQGNGLDNTPNQGTGQSANDLSLQQYQFAYYIKLIANEVNDTALVAKYTTEMNELGALIQEKLWSEQGSFFFNLNSAGTAFTNIATPTGLWSLAAGLATEQQAQKMIDLYALNSEKMFRPGGLSTVTYDYSSFKPTGGYWNGAMWSPTSYQYLKGLQQYGYDDLAFEEAVRHIDALSRVCKKGAYDRYGSYLYTLWENYSSEYDLPGSTENRDTEPSRSNFVGWAGALGIGSIIEDIVGVTLDAPSNTVNWNLKLTEGFGIDKLWMKGNSISLSCASRLTATSAASLTITAQQPFTLKVKNGSVTQSFSVPAGTSTLSVSGADSGAGAYIGGKSDAADTFAPSQEADLVTFTNQTNSAVTDGLKNQSGRNPGKNLYNINTVGYRNAAVQESPAASALLGGSLYEYRKAGVNDGFMVMAKAGTQLKTMKMLVGVKNATAVVDAVLSDASVLNFKKTLSAGAAEKVFAVEIPFRAASDGKSLLVKYLIQSAQSDGSISLKAVSLEDGGTLYPAAPAAPKDITLTSDNHSLAISADLDGVSYDSFKVYYGFDPLDLSENVTFTALPAALTGLQNYKRYYVAVVGVKDGMESELSPIKSEVPELVKLSDRERALGDWEAIRDTVLNGNTGFDDIKSFLVFDGLTGPVYGSSFSFSVSSNAMKNGVQPNGQVIVPKLPQPDAANYITVTVTCGDAVVTVVERATVKAVDVSDYPYAAGQKTITSGTVNLTTDGTADWVQFNSSSLSSYAQKNVATPLITNIAAIKNTEGNANDAPFYFTATDAKGSAPVNRRGLVARGLGNGYAFTLPYHSNRMQNLKIYTSIWAGTVTVELAVNGNILYTDSFGRSDTSSGLRGQCFDIKYKVPGPDDAVTVRLICTQNLDQQWGGASHALQALTLSDTNDQIPTPPIDDLPDENFYAYNEAQPALVSLTAEGSRDWRLFNSSTLTAIDKKSGGTGIGNLATLATIRSDLNPNNSDVTFSWTDGTNTPSGTFRRGIILERANNGLTYTLPYSKNPQTANIYVGAWSAKAELKAEVMENGEAVKTISSVYDTGAQAGGTPAKYSRFVLHYQLENPNQTVKVTLKTVTAYDATWGNINIGAITLGEILQVTAEQNVQNGKIRVTPGITAQGTKVHVFATPDEGCRLVSGSLKYVTESGAEQAITGDSFLMPGENVTVTARFERMVTGVTIPSSARMYKGETKILGAVVSPADAGNKTIRWTSDNAVVAAVDAQSGEITALSKGSATITAVTQDGGFTASCALIVSNLLTINAPTGETVVVPITLEDCDRVAGLTGAIEYDESLLTLQSITAKRGWQLVSEGSTFVAVSADGMGVSGDVVIGYAVFAAKEGLLDDVSARVRFPADAVNAFDETLAPADPFLPDVLVQLIGIPPMPGDINLDGEVDLSDAILLMQYLSGNRALTVRQLKAADINNDGKVNVGDVTIIMQRCL